MNNIIIIIFMHITLALFLWHNAFLISVKTTDQSVEESGDPLTPQRRSQGDVRIERLDNRARNKKRPEFQI